MDFAEAGLLDGLEGNARRARVALLERLAAEGATLAELALAVREERLALLPLERLLGGRYTAREVHERTGTPVEILLRMRRLGGLPEPEAEDRVFGDEDIRTAESLALFVEAGFELEALSELARVIGETMSRLSATVAAQFGETFLRAGDTELEVAERFEQLAERLRPALAPVLVGAFDAHLRESVHRGMISRSELEAGRLGAAQELTVCFADLVGFTRLGGKLEVHELSGVAGRLARLAGDVAEPPVRLVKTIGDAAMFVSPDPDAMVASALRLIDAAAEADLPSLRAGVAAGQAAQRAGDYFGHSVNLASRVTGVARPSSVLCTQEVQEATPEAFRWSYAGRFRLKGISEPVRLHRARPPARADEPGASAAVSERREDRPRRRESR
jgi:adenylate cyclase